MTGYDGRNEHAKTKGYISTSSCPWFDINPQFTNYRKMPLFDKLKSAFLPHSQQQQNESAGGQSESLQKQGQEEEGSKNNRNRTYDPLSEVADPEPPRRPSLEERLMESQKDS